MSLRLQLLAFVALTLFLPWAGLRIVEAMEESLRLGLEGFLQQSARLVARDIVESGTPGLRMSPDDTSEPLYMHLLSRPPRVDGEQTDWHYARDASADAASTRLVELTGGHRLWLGVDPGYPGFLYLFIDVVDNEIVYQADPGRPPHGDRVVLVSGREADRRRFLLLASAGEPAPGQRRRSAPIRAQVASDGERFIPTGRTEDIVYAWWQDTATGFRIEARVPLSLVDGSLGIGIIDSYAGGADARLAARTWTDGGEPNALIGESGEIDRVLSTFAGSTDRYRVFDANGWVLADTGAFADPVVGEAETSPPLLERLFRRLLRRDDPEYAATLDSRPGRIADPAILSVLNGGDTTAWYRRGADASAIVAAAVPIDPGNPGRGGVLIEQVSDSILTLTNRAMLRLVTITVLVSLVATAALLAYASLLSFRIGRLARAAESALGPRGEIRTALPGSKAGDEIGNLSRSFQDLLGRLRDYTDYLQSLKSKLSHEIRTPLAIVATSADNLQHETETDAGKAYLARLREGALRLESILQAMTAATRVEQAIRQAEPETFDLAAVVRSCVSSYRDVYEGRRFEIELPDEPVRIEGSADLIAQMLDKLVDNAAGFASEGTPIVVTLRQARAELRLEVVNRGPPLPDEMRHQLFDSLVSIRDDTGDRPHLGLGLYIVTLVAEFHGGRVDADNLEDGSGVRMSVVLPRGNARSA